MLIGQHAIGILWASYCRISDEDTLHCQLRIMADLLNHNQNHNRNQRHNPNPRFTLAFSLILILTLSLIRIDLFY